MIVFILMEHTPEDPESGIFSGAFSSMDLAKFAAFPGKHMHWQHCSIDLQSEPEAWQCEKYVITMVELDVDIEGTKLQYPVTLVKY